MTRQNGFIPLYVIIIGALSLTAATFAYLRDKPVSSPITVVPISGFPTPSPTVTPSQALKKIVSSNSPTPKPQLKSAVLFSINDNGSAILDPNLTLKIKDEWTGQIRDLQNTASNWTVLDLPSGKYRFYVNFPQNRYFNPGKSCEGCTNKQDISNFDTCGYILDLKTADNIRISCNLRTTQPLNGQTGNSNPSGSDTTPPNTNVSYPQQNGSITYKTDGKVCAIATEPNDNQGPGGIETEYVFDDGNWSGYASNRAYLCADTLANGQHTLSYRSKDKAGNVENTKSVNFTVDIPGN